MWKWLIIILFVLIVIRVRVKKRGYLIKDREGKKVTTREFFKRWKEGYEEVTPLQQTKIVLWSFIPMFAGILWGIVVTFIAKTYWMTLILSGSLPITSVQFLSNLQRYKSQKKVQEIMDNLNKRSVENDCE